MMKWLTNLFCSKKPESQEVLANQKSQEQLGWTPQWFGSSKNDEALVENVKKYQSIYKTEETGIVDTGTFRRRIAEKEAVLEVANNIGGKTIICNGQRVPIKWDKVVLFRQPHGFTLPNSHYRTFPSKRDVSMFVVHWDVCLSSKTCFNILKKRGLSVHFMIDNDGTIYQLVDTQHATWHAGNRAVNNKSVGVEISNAYYPKFQKVYEQRGFGPRPIWTNDVTHAKEFGDKFLGFYDVQLEALKALTKALHDTHNIPLETPQEGGKLIKTVHQDSKMARFKGVVNHFHLTTRKIDCAGLELDRIVDEVKNG